MTIRNELKPAVTVSEMATMCGFSRSRFYELLDSGVFPPPVYKVSTHRPFYTEELQQLCLEICDTGRRIDGNAVQFNSTTKKNKLPTRAARVAKGAPNGDGRFASLLAYVRKLGLHNVTVDQVTSTFRRLYPAGAECDPETTRAVFLALHKDTRGNAGASHRARMLSD